MPLPEKEQFSTEIVNGGAENSGPIPKAAGSFYVSVKVKSSLPDFLNTVNLKYVKLGYGYLLSHSFYFLVVPIVAVIFSGATAKVRKQMILWEDAAILTCDFIDVVLIMGILGFILYICVGLTPRSTYLVDFACYRPPNELKVSKDEFIDLATKSGNFNKEAIEFQKQILNDSGIGDETYMPASIFKPGYQITLRDGREEAAMAMFGAINDLFNKTKIRPKDIKILVVNCGVLNTTPSLSSMVVNHFKMRNDIQSFNLGGMGCSAGMIAIDLANDLLSAYQGSYGIVVSTEAVTYTWYKGNDLDLLIPNCFFRMGAAALLLSNGRRDWWRAKYQLKQLVRTHKGMDDTSFKCIRLREDTSGRQGISVSKEVIEVGINALRDNIASLSHLLHNTHISISDRLYFSLFNNNNNNEKTKVRINQGSGREVLVDHVCILAASKTVLDEVKKRFGIREEWMEASRKTLERFGNTSSSSVWYELAYLEANGKVKKKDIILQIAFGSGFKCNSLVLEALRTPRKLQMNPWV